MWMALALMLVYMVVVAELGGGDSRMMTNLANMVSDIIFFGGIIFLISRIVHNKKLLKDRALLREQLCEVMDTLSEREQKVLSLRFGLLDGKPHTLEEVGKDFQVTRERIRQIEAKALRKLRHPTRSRKLRDFLDM